MKANSKNKTFFLLLFLLIFHFGNSQTQNDFYGFLDNQVENKTEYKFLSISLIKNCENKYLFSISQMIYNDNVNKKHLIYEYKGVPIIYVPHKEYKRTKCFFKKKLKKGKFDVNTLPKSPQSVINSYAMYFIDNQYIKDEKETRDFMTSDCK